MTVKNLIVIAHPDDETLFFSRIMASFPRSTYVICVTDGNDAGRGKARKREFNKALKMFGVKGRMLGFSDNFGTPLNPHEIARQLHLTRIIPNTVYTHSFYDNHWHHVSVALACRMWAGWKKVRHFKTFSERKLPKKIFELKKKIILDVYTKEMSAIFSARPRIDVEDYEFFGDAQYGQII